MTLGSLKEEKTGRRRGGGEAGGRRWDNKSKEGVKRVREREGGSREKKRGKDHPPSQIFSNLITGEGCQEVSCRSHKLIYWISKRFTNQVFIYLRFIVHAEEVFTSTLSSLVIDLHCFFAFNREHIPGNFVILLCNFGNCSLWRAEECENADYQDLQWLPLFDLLSLPYTLTTILSPQPLLHMSFSHFFPSPNLSVIPLSSFTLQSSLPLPYLPSLPFIHPFQHNIYYQPVLVISLSCSLFLLLQCISLYNYFLSISYNFFVLSIVFLLIVCSCVSCCGRGWGPGGVNREGVKGGWGY